MKIAKGNTYTTLLAVKVEQGTLYASLTVPMSIGDLCQTNIERMGMVINDRIRDDKKPAATFVKCLERINLHRAHLTQAYVELFETYQRMLTPAARTSPIDKARTAMFDKMPDKLLKANAELYIGLDKVNDFILPDEREQLIDTVVAAMRETKE